jgi:F-type H+-transporting ATPase subunit b
MLAFVAFVVFCMKYVWPPILAAMQSVSARFPRARGSGSGQPGPGAGQGKSGRAPEGGQGRGRRASSRPPTAAPARSSKKPRIAADAEAERIKIAAQAEIEQEKQPRARTAARAGRRPVAGRRRESTGCVRRCAGACGDRRQTRGRALGAQHGRTEHTGAPLRQGRLRVRGCEGDAGTWLHELSLIAAVVEDARVQRPCCPTRPSPPTPRLKRFVGLCGDELGDSRKRFVHVLAENRRLAWRRRSRPVRPVQGAAGAVR